VRGKCEVGSEWNRNLESGRAVRKRVNGVTAEGAEGRGEDAEKERARRITVLRKLMRPAFRSRRE
jgi:hypothetical protein